MNDTENMANRHRFGGQLHVENRTGLWLAIALCLAIWAWVLL